jgi:integrase
VRNIRIRVRAILTFALKQGIVSRNVTDLVEPPAPAHVERTIVTLHNIRAIIYAARGTELESVVPFALGTGLRRSEMCALKWRDIDLSAGTIRVQRAAVNLDGTVVIKATKTRKSVRTDYLAPFVISVLLTNRQQQADRRKAHGLDYDSEQGFVFDRSDGRAWDPNEMSRAFSRLVRRHKLPPLRLHDLRHSYASLAFAAGVPLQVVSEFLGHASVGITAGIYVHLLDESKRQKSNKLDAYLGKAISSLRALSSSQSPKPPKRSAA